MRGVIYRHITLLLVAASAQSRALLPLFEFQASEHSRARIRVDGSTSLVGVLFMEPVGSSGSGGNVAHHRLDPRPQNRSRQTRRVFLGMDVSPPAALSANGGGDPLLSSRNLPQNVHQVDGLLAIIAAV
jgi:hypothetical protein